MYAAKDLVSKVEIHVSCSGLRDKDVLSKSDPFVVMFTKPEQSDWVEFARTETAENNLNPVFVKGFTIDYYFEQYQLLKFEVYDCDSRKSKLSEHEFLGQLEVSLGSLVGENCGKLSRQLVNRKGVTTEGGLTVLAEEMSTNNSQIRLTLKGVKLDSKDFMGKSDPYLIFYRSGVEDPSKRIMVHKTEVIKNTLNPDWKEFTLPLSTLCNGDKDRQIVIECFDWDSDTDHDLIGVAHTTINALLSGQQKTMDLINPKKKAKKKNYVNSGRLELVNITEIQVPTFLEFIMGGMEICIHISVDFTGSNGDPRSPDSLHFIDPMHPNEYMQALLNVGRICEDYDSDKMIPAYGFGAFINGQVYHNFNLNYTANPTCFGINGVISAYQSTIQQVKLFGPTNFTPTIRTVCAQVQNESVNKYHVLLIITDGVISDMEATISAIIDASKLPMSIIIIGVGGADFSGMDRLDCDSGMLSLGKKRAERDIVQFVPFRKFTGPYCNEALGKEVLKELPNQLVKYMMGRNIRPQPRPAYQPQVGGRQYLPPQQPPAGPPAGQLPPQPGTTYPPQGVPPPQQGQYPPMQQTYPPAQPYPPVQ